MNPEHHPDALRRLMSTGNVGEAMRRLPMMLEQHPSDPQALTVATMLRFQAADFDSCVEMLRRLVEIEPGKALNWSMLGKSLLMRADAADARTAYEKALALEPLNPSAIAGMAEVLNRLGEQEEGLTILRQAKSKGVNNSEMSLVEATILQQLGRSEEAMAEARQFWQSPSTPAVFRGRLGFLLGRLLESAERYDEAFTAYADANQVRAAAAKFDPEMSRRQTDQMIEYFSTARLGSFSRSTLGSEVPVAILGMPRSGTTLTEQIIQAHPEGHGAGETPAMDRHFRRLAMQNRTQRYPEFLGSLTPADLDSVGEAYLKEVLVGRPDARRAVDKYLRNSSLAGMFWMVFPKCRLIWCQRDPMDTCFSCYTNPLPPNIHPWSSDLRHLGTAFRFHQRLAEHWRDTLDLPFLELVYEEVVADSETWIRRIIDFCGLSWDERCLQAHESKRAVMTISYDQVRRPIFDTSIGRWKRFEKHLGPLRESLGI